MPEQGHAWGNGLETQKRKGRLKREGSFARTRTRLMAGLAERIGGEESSEEAWICWNSMLRKRINLYPCSLAVQFVNRGYVYTVKVPTRPHWARTTSGDPLTNIYHA